MKRTLINYLKIGIFFFGISILLSGCENDIDTLDDQGIYKTVSIDETLTLFNIVR